jgi:hypothetical protein
MITLRDFGFAVIGVVAGPFVAIGILIGVVAWNKPMASVWLQFPNENWHHVAIRLSPWPVVFIDGGPFYPNVAETYIWLNSRT